MRFLKAEVGQLVAFLIESQHAIETDALDTDEERTQWDVFLHRAASAYANDVQMAADLFLLARLKIDVGKGIQFVHHDVAVVGTDTGGDTRYAFALVATRNGVELTALYITFDAPFVKEGCHHIHAILVAYEDDLVGKKFGLEVQMKCTAIVVDDQLTGGKYSIGHKGIY